MPIYASNNNAPVTHTVHTQTKINTRIHTATHKQGFILSFPRYIWLGTELSLQNLNTLQSQGVSTAATVTKTHT